ncbi:MAG: DUF1822 family protein [Leptolyngbya sp. SIO4C5]|nr:DUF1822 family protein [Leptolyngbya sp. SIO4C5]
MPLSTASTLFTPPESNVMTDTPFADFEPLSPTSVSLNDDQMSWAISATESIADAAQHWRAYLLALAVAGWQQWLGTTATDLRSNCESLAAPYERAVCQIGLVASSTDPAPSLGNFDHEFHLSLLVSGSLSDEVVLLPRAAVTAAQSHFYVLVEVQEEQRQVAIAAILRHDQLMARLQAQPTMPLVGDRYQLPLSWFTTSSSTLLLFLRHANPASLLSAAAAATEPIASLPDASYPVAASAGAAQPFLNVAHWLQDQLDELAQQFAWTLLPEPVRALRSPTEEFETILSDLETNDIAVPSRARAAFTDLQLGGLLLRLYALTWTIYDDPSQPEWSLMLFLGSASEDPLPVGTVLQVRDQETLLAEQTLSDQAASFYLYAQVFGHWHETFQATVALPSGPQLHLPPFGLALEA